MEFEAFPKLARLHRECVVTEKIDGTNAQIAIDTVAGTIQVGSRTRWLSEHGDNHGFYKWVMNNQNTLVTQLGDGRHYGEWWGGGINKRYPGAPKQFSLFNATRWKPIQDTGALTVCQVVPLLYHGPFDMHLIMEIFHAVRGQSRVWELCKNPEGIVIFHTAQGYLFKKTYEHDERGKPE